MPAYTTVNAETDGTTLTAAERSHIRMILGVPESSAFQLYLDSESRFTALAANTYMNKLARTLYKAYDVQGDSMVTFIDPNGVSFSTPMDRTRIAVILQQLVFPSNDQHPLEPIFDAQNRNSSTSNISFVPATWGNETSMSDSEY